MMEYTSGNAIVDKMIGVDFTGNVIPSAWYKTVVNKKTGKPYDIAITLLSDIVYWYRPKEVRDELTGEFKGYEKKFKEDLLQRSYEQIEKQFGYTHRQAKSAVVFLEELGVVKRIFRHITVRDQQMNNVMYLELVPEKLMELTYPEKHVYKNVHTSVPKSTQVCTDSGTGAYKNVQTNTKNTAEKTDKDYHISSYRDVRESVMKQIDYDAIAIDFPSKLEQLDGIVNIITDVMHGNQKTIRVNKEDVPGEVVREKFARLNMFHIQNVLEGITESTAKIRNPRAMIITSLYNVADTMDIQMNSKVKMLLKKN